MAPVRPPAWELAAWVQPSRSATMIATRAAPACARPAESVDLTLHEDRLDPDAVGHGQHNSLDLLKSEGPVQRDARKGRAEIHTFEAFGAGRVSAGLKNRCMPSRAVLPMPLSMVRRWERSGLVVL